MTARPVRRLLRVAAMPVMRFASRAYVPGPQLDDAMRWVQRMDREDIACTLGYFNAAEDPVDLIARMNCAAIEALAGTRKKAYASIKVPPLRYTTQSLQLIADCASRHGQLLHFDSHGPETADRTLDALEAVRARYARLGLTIPARWRRSLADADWASERGVRVRIVKGQWACPERPESDLRASFLEVIDRLAGRGVEVAVATHDVPLAREALGRLLRAGTACELELLCGLPRRTSIRLAREMGVPIRLYIPFGDAWMPYAMDQVARNPRMAWWLVRDSFNALLGA